MPRCMGNGAKAEFSGEEFEDSQLMEEEIGVEKIAEQDGDQVSITLWLQFLNFDEMKMIRFMPFSNGAN